MTPSYGQPDPTWPTYDQAAPAPVYQATAYPTAPVPSYPAMAYPQTPGGLVAGQVVQTPYGAFMVGGKSKLAAGLLGVFLGGLGAGQFYRGNVGTGVAQLLVTIFTAGFGGLWGFIEGIVVLVSQPGQAGSLDSNRQLMM